MVWFEALGSSKATDIEMLLFTPGQNCEEKNVYKNKPRYGDDISVEVWLVFKHENNI